MAELEPFSGGELAGQAGMSLGNRLVNIFVSPAEVFDDVKVSPPDAANWWVPMALVIVVGIIYSMVVFSQPGVIQGMKDMQEKKMQQQVDAGKMTRAQADQALQMIDKFMGPTTMKVFGIVGILVVQPIGLFLGALVLWLLGKWVMRGNFPYMKAVEVVGLASMISMVDEIVRMLLAIIYANPSITLGPVLLVHYDVANKIHGVLAALDLIGLWTVAVMAIGLSRLSGGSFVKAAAWCFGLWAVVALVPPLIFGGH